MDRLLSVFFKEAGSRSREMDPADDRFIPFFVFNPFQFIPGKPVVFLLIKNMQWFVADFAEFGAPSCAAFDGLIVEYFTNDKRFLTVVNLIPDTLENLAESFVIRVTAIH